MIITGGEKNNTSSSRFFFSFLRVDSSSWASLWCRFLLKIELSYWIVENVLSSGKHTHRQACLAGSIIIILRRRRMVAMAMTTVMASRPESLHRKLRRTVSDTNGREEEFGVDFHERSENSPTLFQDVVLKEFRPRKR